jgi:hypothetical protein
MNECALWLVLTAVSFCRLRGAQVHISEYLVLGNQKCGEVSTTRAPSVAMISCDGKQGRYVSIMLPRTDYLVMCEVRIYGEAVTGFVPITFLDLKGMPVQQSSGTGMSAASKAVDGNTNSYYGAGSCTHTGHDTDNFWRVDLQKVYTVSQVQIANRVPYTERLNGVEVYVGDHTNWKNNAKCGSVASAGLKPVINCDGKAGRFVQVRVPRKEWLSLCEVLVEATVSTTQHTLIPLAGKPVEQSGNHGSYTASRAIDGDANQNFGSGKCSHTNKGPNPTWWRVDLQGTYKVSQVEIFNSGTDQR